MSREVRCVVSLRCNAGATSKGQEGIWTWDVWGTYHPRVDEPPVPEQQLQEDATHAPDVRDIPAVLTYRHGGCGDGGGGGGGGGRSTREEERQLRLQGYREQAQTLVLTPLSWCAEAVCLESTLPATTISGAKKPGEPQKSLKRFVAWICAGARRSAV